MSVKQISTARRRIHFRKLFAVICFGLIGGTIFAAYGQSRQLSLADILIALRSKKAVIEEKNRILAEAVKQRGITFELTPEIEKELGSTGAYRELLDAIRQKATPAESSTFAKTEAPKLEIAAAKPAPPPPDFAFYRQRANTYLASGELDLAIADLGKALEFRSSDVQSLADRASVYLKQNKPDLAAADLDRCLEIEPNNSAALFSRALIWEKTGNTDKALALYDKALEADPKNEPARTQAAQIRDAQAQVEKKRLEAAAAAAKEQKVAEPRVVSVGAMNQFAENLSVPVYSVIDKRMGVQGKVTVQITLDESGKVIFAQATEGPKTLRNSAVEAVKRSRFKPVTVQGKAVSASGFIVYNFVAN